MFSKEWKGDYQGHQVVVTNNWGVNATLEPESGGAKLYIDGECVDQYNGTFVTSSVPSLRGRIVVEDKPHIVEVYMKSGLVKVQAKVVINGERQFGDF